MSAFKGTGVAMVTPFDTNHRVDEKSLEALTNHLIAGGVDYLVVQGTTGEAATLSAEEKQRVLSLVVETVAGRVPVVWGHGGNNTAALIRAFEHISLDGVSAILSASPYYNKPTQAGIVAHYTALADASPLPLILYNVPGRTASNMLADTTLKLADHQNIIGIKEASGNLSQVGQIIKHRPEGFLVISGDDPLVVAHMAMGGDGVISVAANAYPSLFSEMVKACDSGDYETARNIHYGLVDLIDLLFAEGNPGGIKATLAEMGLIQNVLRLPLVRVSDELQEKIKREIQRIGS
ncbi:MAG: 4-hydroxy-tetrahydrodipicolinate synthase [Salibacteraceae bacterium]